MTATHAIVPAITALQRRSPGLPRMPPPSPLATPAAARSRGACACGGRCPRCARTHQAGIQQARSGLRVGAPDDAHEHEADRIAARIDSDAPPLAITASNPSAQLSRKPVLGNGQRDGAHAPAVVEHALRMPGRPLDPEQRAWFEPRLGRSLEAVRVHTDALAAESAHAVQARAYTVGSDVVFASGQFDPRSAHGRSLLAHELAHVVQQDRIGIRVQRSLSIDQTPPTNPQDPLASLGPAAFATLANTEMGAVLHALCDQFDVDSTGKVVTTPADACNDQDAVADGTKPLGCCCLCALTAGGSNSWTIHVTALGGPTTKPAASGGGDFFLHPRSPASSFDFGYWDVTGGKSIFDPVVVAGHELCGHGALIERDVHPEELERVDTDVHDPTVKVENQLRAEQGLPGAERGLATGAHRGESFARITIRDFAFNSASVAAAQQSKIQLAKDFINANNTWVDIFGHSDLVGSASAKLAVSQARADSMKTLLTNGTRPVATTITKRFDSGAAVGASITVSGNRFTRVEGRSDFHAIAGAAASDLRRVDIDMPTRPAGAEVPNPGTPTTTIPALPQSLPMFLRRRFFGSACDRLLAKSAWF